MKEIFNVSRDCLKFHNVWNKNIFIFTAVTRYEEDKHKIVDSEALKEHVM